MKNKYLYLIIVLLILTVITLLSYERSDSIEFKNYEVKGSIFDFGNIIKNDSTIIIHRFNYINKLHPILKVYGVKDACDCTFSSVTKKRI